MSYCTAERHEAQVRIRELEQRLKEATRRGNRDVERLREELRRAVAELVAVGDCSD